MQIPMPIRRGSDHVSSGQVVSGVVIATLLILSQAAATGQTVTAKLVVVEEVALPSFADHPTLVPIKSDSDGNFYVQFYQAPTLVGRTPITEIGSDGSQRAVFQLGAIPSDALGDQGVKHAYMTDFSVAPSGDLHELVGTGQKTYIVQFSSKGEYEGAVALEGPPAYFKRIVALPHDRFFLSGFTAGNVSSEAPVNSIYNANSQLITNVSFPGDVEPLKSKELKPQESPQPGAVVDAVNMGTALAGQDGNVYVMREASPARIFVIGPDGKLVRTLQVPSPLPGADPETFKLNGSKLAILFAKSVGGDQPDEIVFRVVDSATGIVLGDYKGGVETSRWAGYNDNGFLFLGAKNGKITRIRAIPQ